MDLENNIMLVQKLLKSVPVMGLQKVHEKKLCMDFITLASR